MACDQVTSGREALRDAVDRGVEVGDVPEVADFGEQDEVVLSVGPFVRKRCGLQRDVVAAGEFSRGGRESLLGEVDGDEVRAPFGETSGEDAGCAAELEPRVVRRAREGGEEEFALALLVPARAKAPGVVSW